MSYAKEWAAAIERSRRFGLEVPTHEVQTSHRYLTDARHAEFPYVVQRGLGELDYPDVVAQCMSIHYRLLPVLEAWLGCPVLYTIGWVDDGTDTGMFKFDDAFVTGRPGCRRASSRLAGRESKLLERPQCRPTRQGRLSTKQLQRNPPRRNASEPAH